MQIIDEYYHVYNRGAHKAPIFHDENDYMRFIGLLYVANDTKPIRKKWFIPDPWSIPLQERLVEIFAYCLMPNHYHIGLKEIRDGGIHKFITKIITGYTMYYNKKYKHSGTILQGNYKCKHINNDMYLRYLVRYIHLNPYYHNGKILDDDTINEAIEFSIKYEYSSYKDYSGIKRFQNAIIKMIE